MTTETETVVEKTPEEQEISTFTGQEFHDGEPVEKQPPAEEPDAEAAVEQDQEAEAAGAADDSEGDADKQKKSVQQRIDELTRDRRAEQRRNAELERELAELKAGKKAEPEPTKEDVAPDPSQYEYGELDPKFMRDSARYEVRQELAEQRKQAAEKAEKAKFDAAMRDRSSKAAALVEEGTAIYKDFRDVVDRNDLPVSPELADLVLDSEHKVDLAYHLAKDVALLRAIQSKGPLHMAREVGKLEVRLAAEAEARKAKKPSKAPDPPRHEVRGGGGRFSVGGDTNDFAAFEKAANASL